MAIPFLDEIEKLINEHGSAPILKERLGLIQDKAAEFERKFNLLTKENLVLRHENAKQKADNTRLITENMALKERLKAYEQPRHDNLLNDIEVKLLLYLASNKNKTPKQIAEAIGITDAVVDFHLAEMSGKGLVSVYAVDLWCLVHKGLKYLIENKLIS